MAFLDLFAGPRPAASPLDLSGLAPPSGGLDFTAGQPPRPGLTLALPYVPDALDLSGLTKAVGSKLDLREKSGPFADVASKLTFPEKKKPKPGEAAQPSGVPAAPGAPGATPRATGVPGAGQPAVGVAAPAAPADVASISLSGLGPGQKEEFWRRSMALGVQLEGETGIPAELFAALAANESNFGNAPGNIMGGVKADRNDPNAIWLDTWEMEGGRRVNRREPFVASATALDGMRTVGRTLQSGRYAPAYQALTAGQIDGDEFIRRVNAAGYATNPNWAQGEIIPLTRQARPYRPAPPPAVPLPTLRGGPSGEPPAVPLPTLPADPSGGPPAVPLPDLGAPTTPNAGSPFQGEAFTIAFDVHQRYSTPLPSGTTHHRGVDIVPAGRGGSAGLGTPVTALAGGVVQAFHQGGAQGNAVVLQAADGLYHAYFHLLDRSPLTPGTTIMPGQPIGRMGQSGSEGFPHLHLEVRRRINGDDRAAVIDPLAYFGLR